MEPRPETSGPVRSPSRPRRFAGAVVALITVALAALFVAGVVNPWRLVVLERQFGNPLFGIFVVAVGAYAALWLLTPVRNEAVQRARGQVRMAVAVVALLGLFGWALFGRMFAADYEELTRSDDGTRAVALVTQLTDERQHARVWEGTGLLTRDAGEIGRACGSVTARFISDDAVEIQAGYGPWRTDLDPETGAPLQVLGPQCPDGPEPLD
jgi:hypothetical protein